MTFLIGKWRKSTYWGYHLWAPLFQKQWFLGFLENFPPGGSRWVNEPARASEPLGVHWGNFAESRVLKQTWLRDGRTDGRTGQDLDIFIFMGERFRGQLNPLWVSQFGMYSSHWIESRTRYAYKKYTCDLFDLGDENYIIFCSLEELGWEFCFEGQ